MATETGMRSRVRDAAAGAALATGGWLCLAALGAAQLAGVSEWGMIAWFAGGGVLLGALGILVPLWSLLGGGVAALLVVGWSPLLDHRLQRWVREDRTGGAPVDAVVVLSGSLSAGGRIGIEAVDRLLGGIEVRRRAATRTLVLTRSQRLVNGSAVSSEPDQRALVARFDPEATLEVVGPVHNTHDEAVGVSLLARRRGWRRVAVVTSPLHTRRACAAFEHEALLVVCRPAESRAYSLRDPLRPGDRLAAFRDWIYEAAGYRVYRWKGWIGGRANRNEAGPWAPGTGAPAPQSLSGIRTGQLLTLACRWRGDVSVIPVLGDKMIQDNGLCA